MTTSPGAGVARVARSLATRFATRFAVAATLLVVAASGAQAQVADSIRPAALAVTPAVQPARGGPPLTPGRAFLRSFLVPGLAQARFDRGSAGALFVVVEVGALAMVKRTTDQLREARRFLGDSLPTDFNVGSNGDVTPVARSTGGFTQELIRRRRLHREDWIAVIAFNHLLAGADAFVSAQLWDLPMVLSAYPTSGGGVLVATLRW